MIERLLLTGISSIAGFYIGDAKGTETGGIVLGFVEGVTAVPLASSGPGPRAVLAPDSFEWDPEYIAAWLRRRGEAIDRLVSVQMIPGDMFFGRWHKHTLPLVRPSETDRESASAIVERLGASGLVEVIFACDGHDKPLHVGAWWFDGARYHDVEIVRP